MSFRFRKSIKIAPGLRVNVSRRGASLSVGGRGLTTNVSSRGVRTTVGIPGTGISYSTTTSGGDRGRRSGGLTKADLAKIDKEEKRKSDLEEAEAEIAEYKAELDELLNIHRFRQKENFNWDLAARELPEFVELTFSPIPFSQPQRKFDKESCKIEAAHAFSFPRIFILGGLVTAFLSIGYPFYALPVLGAIIGAAIYNVVQSRRQIEELSLSKLNSYEAAYQQEIAAAKSAYELLCMDQSKVHAKEQKRLLLNHEADQKFRKDLREFQQSQNLEPLADLLEFELTNEDLPVHLEFDIQFENERRVEIKLIMPPFETIPEEEPYLNKKFSVSKKKLTKKERIVLYSTMCAGLTLRLIHESFRVVPFLDKIDLKGFPRSIDIHELQSVGHCLEIFINREAFQKVDLDEDPLESFTLANGKIAINRQGDFVPI